MSASGDHRRYLGALRWREVGEIGMSLREQVPGMAPFRQFVEFECLAARINGFYVADVRRLASYSDRNAIIAQDVREFLTVAVDQKIERPTFVA